VEAPVSKLRLIPVALVSVALGLTACGQHNGSTVSSVEPDVAQRPLREKPSASQEVEVKFQCDPLTDYTAIDAIKPVVRRHATDAGAFKFSVENFLMICADKVKATAAFDTAARRLGVDMRPEGLKHCLCKYELDPIAVGVPNDPSGAPLGIEDYLLTLSKTESDAHKVMFEAKIGSIAYKEARPE
jgi:hypothetical protein